MSGRVTTPQFRRHRLLPLLGLFVVAGLVAAVGFVVAQDDPNIDDKSPLPPDDPKRAALAEKYRLNKKLAIFGGRRDSKTGKVEGGILDFGPVATEKENQEEYEAWTYVIQHAKQFTTVELEANAARDLTRDDLLEPTRNEFRLDLVRLDGRLTRGRRVTATESLKLAGTTEVYEIQLAPLDDPPTDVVSVIISELPAELAAVKQFGGEWAEIEKWGTVAGFFFKVKKDPGGEPIPVLIGKSVSVLKAQPTPPGDNPAVLDKNLRVFKQIKDDSRIAKAETNWEEVSAWNRVLLHARRFMPDDLEKHALTGVKFADLFLDNRRDHKLDLVKFEGRLIKLDKMKPTPKLAAAGVETLYEGWMVPRDEPSGHPICVVFTDPPEGVEPVGRVNKWVSFAGYSFKLMWYESGERDKKDPNKNVVKKTPLLLGRAVVVRPDPDNVNSGSWGTFVTVVVAIVVGLITAGLAVNWWFRRGDRKAIEEIQAHRSRNPFNDPTN